MYHVLFCLLQERCIISVANSIPVLQMDLMGLTSACPCHLLREDNVWLRQLHGCPRDALWLAHGLSYHVVSQVFDVPKMTVFDTVLRMCDTIFFSLGQNCKIMQFGSVCVMWPTAQPSAGATDGCCVHIKATTMLTMPELFVSYRKDLSLMSWRIIAPLSLTS